MMDELILDGNIIDVLTEMASSTMNEFSRSENQFESYGCMGTCEDSCDCSCSSGCSSCTGTCDGTAHLSCNAY